jgi:hypothetical protein
MSVSIDHRNALLAVPNEGSGRSAQHGLAGHAGTIERHDGDQHHVWFVLTTTKNR